MSLIVYLFQAWMIGIAIGAIVGPIGLLFIRKTLEVGVRGAVAVGLGAALADGVYGVIAALGISTISHFLLEKSIYIKLLGGVFLLYLAYKDLKHHPAAKAASVRGKKTLKLAINVFFLTLANPVTIASFIGIFAGISNGPASPAESLVMAFGVFMGSLTWWVILGSILLKIKHKLPDSWLHRIKYVSALILGCFGSYGIYSGLMAL